MSLTEVGAGNPAIEYYYDFSGRRLVALGCNALSLSIENSEYLQRLVEQERLAAIEEVDENNLIENGAAAGIWSWPKILTEAAAVYPLPVEQRLDVSDWSNTTYIDFIRVLHGIVKNAYPQQNFNQNIVAKNYHLGLGPSGDHIRNPHRFRTLSRLYQEAGLTDVQRMGNFDHLSTPELIKIVRIEAKRLGRAPTHADFNNEARRDPNFPGASIYRRRLGAEAFWSRALELAGIFAAESVDNEGYKKWGVKFMLANNGLIPSVRHINILSKKLKGPSGRGVQLRFGSLGDFQQEIVPLYEKEVLRRLEDRRRKLEIIESRLVEGSLPPELFEGAADKKEVVKRYAKYAVLEELNGTWGSETKVSLSTDGWTGLSFERAVVKSRPEISVADIEHTAEYLGVFEDIWPMDEYLTELKLSVDEVNGLSRGRNANIRWHVVGADHSSGD